MHTDTEQLIALIDGEPMDAVLRKHALQCPDCQARIDEIQRTRSALRALPNEEPPPISPAALGAPTMGRRGLGRWFGAVAAALLVAVLLATLAQRDEGPVADAGRDTDAAPTQASTTPVAAAFQPVAPAVLRQSAQLEQQWRLLKRQRGAVRRLGHATGTARLRARLLELDTRYAPAGDARYWDRRVQLLSSLVDIERAELLAREDRNLTVVRAAHRPDQR